MKENFKLLPKSAYINTYSVLPVSFPLFFGLIALMIGEIDGGVGLILYSIFSYCIPGYFLSVRLWAMRYDYIDKLLEGEPLPSKFSIFLFMPYNPFHQDNLGYAKHLLLNVPDYYHSGSYTEARFTGGQL